MVSGSIMSRLGEESFVNSVWMWVEHILSCFPADISIEDWVAIVNSWKMYPLLVRLFGWKIRPDRASRGFCWYRLSRWSSHRVEFGKKPCNPPKFGSKYPRSDPMGQNSETRKLVLIYFLLCNWIVWGWTG